MISHFTALYDACVLYPAPLRDLLLQLATTDLFRAKWTNQIHEEWIRNLLENRPDLKREQLEITRGLMNAHVRDCLVEGYEALIPVMKLPDPGDDHVLAAAVIGRADVIVTYNLKDFPCDILDKFEIEAQHPDVFLTHLIDLEPGVVCASVKTQRARLKNPSKTVQEFLDTLEQQSLPQTVLRLKEYINLI